MKLVEECIAASEEADALLAVRDVLERFVAAPAGLAEPVTGLTFLHRSPTLTVIDVVWPPGIRLFPHDHRMWAAIGIFGGQEDNEFFRRGEGGGLVSSGGRELFERDVLLLGDDAIHAVSNPSARSYTRAIHAYGGDFVETPRSQWDAAGSAEAPFSMESLRAEFAQAEERFRSS